MASRSRRFQLEKLEQRQLLSHAIAWADGDVSIFAKPKQKTTSVVGTIPGFWGIPNHWNASGNLPGLGPVQMAMTIPGYGGYSTKHGSMTLATSKGTLTFAVVERGGNNMKLTLQNGTNAYAGWSGSGTFNWSNTGSGRDVTSENTFRLKLKT